MHDYDYKYCVTPEDKSNELANRNKKNIALRLFIRNPLINDALSKYAEIEQIVYIDELYNNGDIEIDSTLLDNVVVKIRYQDGFLLIKTSENVDVILSGAIPAKAIHIETMGGCALIDGHAKKLSMGLFIKSNNIVLDMPVINARFVVVFGVNRPNSTVEIKQGVDTNLLRIEATNILLDAKVKSFKSIVKCKLLHNFANGELLFTNQKNNFVRNDADMHFLNDNLSDWYEPEEQHIFMEKHAVLMNKLYRLEKSLLISERIVNEGELNLNGSMVARCVSARFLPKSKTELNDTIVFAKDISISKLANVVGSNSSLQLEGKLYVDGSCVIDNLVATTYDLIVPGVLWGESNLQMVVKGSTTSSGLIGARKTHIKSNYALGSPMEANEFISFKSFTNGGIVGVESLVLDTLATMIVGGGYLYGANVYSKSGVYINLLGYVRSYNFSNINLYQNDWGVNVPCMPQSWSDLIDVNKVLRVSSMFAKSFPVIRGILSAGSLVFSSLSYLYSTGKNYCENHDILEEVINARQSLYDLVYGKDSLVNIAMLVHETKANIITRAATSMQEAQIKITAMATRKWDMDSFKTLVDLLLEAKQVYVSGSILMSHLTNTAVFIHDLQVHRHNNSNFTFESFGAALKKQSNNFQKSVIDNVENLKNIISDPIQLENAVENAKQLFDRTVNRIAVRLSTEHNVPVHMLNSFNNAIETIRSAPLEKTFAGFADDIVAKINNFTTISVAAINGNSIQELSDFKINNELFNEIALEAFTVLSPSVFETSIMSNSYGITATGTVIRYNVFANHYDDVLAVNYSDNTLFDYYSNGKIWSISYSIDARDRYGHSDVNALDVRMSLRRNNEHGKTNAFSRLIVHADEYNISKGAILRSNGQTYVHISHNFTSSGTTDLSNGTLIVAGDVTYNHGSTANANNLIMNYGGQVVRNGQENFNGSPIFIHGDNNSGVKLKATHSNVDEYVAGNSYDAGIINKSGGRRMVLGSEEYSETSKMNVTDADMIYHNNVERNGKEEVTGGSVFIGGNETNLRTSTTKHRATKLFTQKDFISEGDLQLQDLTKLVAGKTTLAFNSSVEATDVIIQSQDGFEANGNLDIQRVIVNGGLYVKLTKTSTNLTKDVIFNADNFSHDGVLKYQYGLQINAKHADSSRDSEIMKIQGIWSSFGLNANAKNMLGREHHENDFEIISDASATFVRDEALSNRKSVDSNIIVRCDDSSPYEYAEPRMDGAHVSIYTAGAVILPAIFDRARGKTFQTYEEADAFVKNVYATYNLPPPPKEHLSWWGKVKKISKKTVDYSVKVVAGCGGYVAVVLECLPGCQAAGILVGAATIGAQQIVNSKDRRELGRVADAALRQAYEQSIIDKKLLSAQERSVLASLAEAEHYLRLDELEQSLTVPGNAGVSYGDIDAQLAAEKIAIASTFSNASKEISQLYSRQSDTIRNEAAKQRELIGRRGIKVGIGTSVNASKNGFNINLTSFASTPQGQVAYGSTILYNHTYSQALRQNNKVPTGKDVLSNSNASYVDLSKLTQLSTVHFPELVEASRQLDSRDYLTSPSFQYKYSRLDNSGENRFDNVTIRQSDQRMDYESYNSRHNEPSTYSSFNQQQAVRTEGSTDSFKPDNKILYNWDRLRGDGDSESMQQNIPSQDEKSAFRKFAELFEPVDDDINTDFYDVKITPELRYGRDFVSRSIGRNTVDGAKAILDINTWRNLGILVWDGMNELSNETFGIANQSSLQRGEKRAKAIMDSWNTFKDYDGITKSYIMLDLVTGFTVNYALSGGFGALDKFAAKKLSHYVLKPLLRVVNEDIQKAHKIRNSFYDAHSYYWPQSTKGNFAQGFLTHGSESQAITPVKLFDIGSSAARVSNTNMPLALGNSLGSGVLPRPMTFSPKAWLLEQYLEQRALNLQNSSFAVPEIIDDVVEHRYPSSCPYTLKLNLVNPVFRKKHGFTDPTVKIHESWSKKDFISEYILLNPEPAMPHEVEIITQWMFERKRALERLNRIDLDVISDPDTKSYFKKVRNQLIHSMQPKDICAIMKEKRGVKIYKPDGETYDHLYEWSGAKRTLKNAINDFNKKGPYNYFNEQEYNILVTLVIDMSCLWERYKKLIDKSEKKCLQKLKM